MCILQAFLRPFVKKATSKRLAPVESDEELDELEALVDDIDEIPDNCVEDDDDDDEDTEEQGAWVVEDDEDADDTLPPITEDMSVIDEESFVRLGELREVDRKEAVGLLTKVCVPLSFQLRCNTGMGTPGYPPGTVPVPENPLGTGDGCRIPRVTRDTHDIYYLLELLTI